MLPDTQFKLSPYWWEAAPPRSLAQQQIDSQCDVAIVGAGYAGLCAALHLARAGCRVQVFEREVLGFGASSRNGGITSGNIRPTQAELQHRFGAERARQIVAEGHAARRYLAEFIAAEGIDCDFAPVGRFYGAMTLAEYDGLAKQADALARETGIAAWAVPRAEVHQHLRSDLYVGGSVRMDIGGLHPAKLLHELLRLAEAAGVKVHAECRVEQVDEGLGQHRVHTARGNTLARHVIICSNGYTDHSDRWLRQRLVPLRSRIVATEDLGEARVRALVPGLKMLTDTRAMTYYFRPSPDGRRILFGGRDAGHWGDDAGPSRHNLRELIKVFPDLAGVQLSHSWSGYVAMNRDMMPRLFQRGALHYATGFCGSGVVWAPWLGRKIAAKLLGRADDVSGFDDRPPRLVPTWRGKAWFMPLVFARLGLKDKKAEKQGALDRAGLS